ncbi:cyclic pyranopterin monophosphate synthase MoaC [Candidatus Poribacteria bacterium]|nr:cyclic pyranopterin monophosphate synthase MoaC [Candidatus Poribacteria bacterium]
MIMQTRMVDVTHKPETHRTAVAAGSVRVSERTLNLIERGEIEKGDPIEVARIAGIIAAKRTPQLIPLCHPIEITSVRLDFEIDRESCRIEIKATVETVARTGVEMEALTAVSIAALTIYDMCKPIDKNIQITDIRLIKKTGGKSDVVPR